MENRNRPVASVVGRSSFVERLIKADAETDAQTGEGTNFAAALSQIAIDLDDLLNTRQLIPTLTIMPKGLEKTILGYGLPDISTLNPDSTEDIKTLTAAIERTVRTHDGRLRNVSVERVDSSITGHSGALEFRIRATLKLERRDIPVCFDTKFQSDTKRIIVDPAPD